VFYHRVNTGNRNATDIFYLYSEKRQKTSCHRQINALVWEMWVAESNGDIGILTGSSDYGLAQIWQKNSPERLA